MKVLLISANTESINMPVAPLGMACVAAAAERAGHRVVSINLMAESDALETLGRRIETIRPDVIGISVRNIDDQASTAPRFLLEPVRDIVSICKKHSGASVVLGGAGYSIFPREALEYLGADMGIRGEGEKAFPLLLEKLARSEEPVDVPGLYCTHPVIANPPAVTREIDSFPLPRPGGECWSLAEPGEEPFWAPFQTRRGCPLRCSYCSTGSIEGALIRKRAIRRVVESLHEFSKAGFDHIFFVDNTFNLPISYAKRLCDAIRSDGPRPIKWRAILHPWKIDGELASGMAAAGCVEVSLGFESGSASLLRRMNKKYRNADVRRASDLLKAVGVRRMGFLLLGCPGETRETARESLEFADSLQLDMVRVTLGPRIYPGAPLAEYARKEGVIKADDDLLRPKFYFEKGLKPWLIETVETWMKDRPNWIR